MESWAYCLGGCIFPCSRGTMHHSLGMRIWFLIIFLPLKEGLTLVPGIGFLLNFNYFVPFGVIENRFNKINFKHYNGNCDYSSYPDWWIIFLCAPPHRCLPFWENYLWTSLSFSYSLKITYILIRQVLSLKTIVVLSVNLLF